MDRLEALGRAHEHTCVAHHEVAALDDFDAHLPRKVGVLEVSRVVGTGRQQHHRRVRHAGGRDVVEHPQQLLRVVLHRTHADVLEHAGERPLHRAAIFEHVAHAAGAAPVVFQHQPLPAVIANQVRAANVDVNVLGHVEPCELAPEMFSRQDVVRRDDAVLEDALLVVDVVEEEVQRRDALRQPTLQILPLLGRDDARQQVEGENLLRSRRVAIDVERDALPEKGHVHRVPLELELLRRERLEVLAELPVVRPRLTVLVQHLVEEPGLVVAFQHVMSRFVHAVEN